MTYDIKTQEWLDALHLTEKSLQLVEESLELEINDRLFAAIHLSSLGPNSDDEGGSSQDRAIFLEKISRSLALKLGDDAPKLKKAESLLQNVLQTNDDTGCKLRDIAIKQLKSSNRSLIPVSWADEQGNAHALLLYITEKTITVFNAGEGLSHHLGNNEDIASIWANTARTFHFTPEKLNTTLFNLQNFFKDNGTFNDAFNERKDIVSKFYKTLQELSIHKDETLIRRSKIMISGMCSYKMFFEWIKYFINDPKYFCLFKYECRLKSIIKYHSECLKNPTYAKLYYLKKAIENHNRFCLKEDNKKYLSGYDHYPQLSDIIDSISKSIDDNLKSLSKKPEKKQIKLTAAPLPPPPNPPAYPLSMPDLQIIEPERLDLNEVRACFKLLNKNEKEWVLGRPIADTDACKNILYDLHDKITKEINSPEAEENFEYITKCLYILFYLLRTKDDLAFKENTIILESYLYLLKKKNILLEVNYAQTLLSFLQTNRFNPLFYTIEKSKKQTHSDLITLKTNGIKPQKPGIVLKKLLPLDFFDEKVTLKEAATKHGLTIYRFLLGTLKSLSPTEIDSYNGSHELSLSPSSTIINGDFIKINYIQQAENSNPPWMIDFLLMSHIHHYYEINFIYEPAHKNYQWTYNIPDHQSGYEQENLEIPTNFCPLSPLKLGGRFITNEGTSNNLFDLFEYQRENKKIKDELETIVDVKNNLLSIVLFYTNHPYELIEKSEDILRLFSNPSWQADCKAHPNAVRNALENLWGICEKDKDLINFFSVLIPMFYHRFDINSDAFLEKILSLSKTANLINLFTFFDSHFNNFEINFRKSEEESLQKNFKEYFKSIKKYEPSTSELTEDVVARLKNYIVKSYLFLYDNDKKFLNQLLHSTLLDLNFIQKETIIQEIGMHKNGTNVVVLVKTDAGVFLSIHLLTGEVAVNGLICRKVTKKDIEKNPKLADTEYAYFPERESDYFKYGKNNLIFEHANNAIFVNYKGARYCQGDHSFFFKNCKNYDSFYYKDKLLVIHKMTGEILYEKDLSVIDQETGLISTTIDSNFDTPKYTLLKTNPTDETPESLYFYRYDLLFHKKQNIPNLYREGTDDKLIEIKNHELSEHPYTIGLESADHKLKILVPKLFFKYEDQKLTLDFPASSDEKIETVEFSLNDHGELLADDVEPKFYLLSLLMLKNKPSAAFRVLKEIEKIGYCAPTEYLLSLVNNMLEINLTINNSGEHAVLTLRLLMFLLKNMGDLKMEGFLLSAITLYERTLHNIPIELQLSSDEIKLLVNCLDTKDTENTISKKVKKYTCVSRAFFPPKSSEECLHLKPIEQQTQLNTLEELLDTIKKYQINLDESIPMQIEARLLEKPTDEQLIDLFHKRDLNLYKQRLGPLDDNSIKDIFQKTGEWIYSTRSLTPSNQPTYKTEDRNASSYLVFEKRSGKSLRDGQKKHLQALTTPKKDFNGHDNYTFQLPMGGGKTTVVIPGACAQKANGENLVGVILTKELYETGARDLSKISKETYNQEAIPLLFDREDATNIDKLKNTLHILEYIQKGKHYFVTTKISIQAIILSYLTLSIKRETPEAVELLKQILNQLINTGDVYFDEIDQFMNHIDHLCFVIDFETFPPPRLITLQTDFWSYFLNSRHYNPNGDTNIDDFTTYLVWDQNSILYNEKILPKDITDDGKNAWISFLMGEEILQNSSNYQIISKRIAGLTAHQKQTLGFLKGQCSTLLKQCLDKTKNVHYGFNPSETNNIFENYTAIPYSGNMQPKAGSLFASIYETFNYSFLTLLSNEVPKDLLLYHLNILDKIEDKKEQKKQIKNFYDSMGIDQTAYPINILIDLDKNKKSVSALIDYFEGNPLKKREFLLLIAKEYIYPKIKINPITAMSTSSQAKNLFQTKQGASGTLDDACVFGPEFTVNLDGLKETYEKLNSLVLNDNKTSLQTIRYSAHNIAEYLKNTVGDDYNTTQAIIDVGILFEGVPHKTIAIEMALYWNSFEKNNNKKYILYFNENNDLCAINIKKPEETIFIGSTENICRLGCSEEDCVVYFDSVRTRGTNIPLGKDAKAIVYVDPEKTTLTDFYQGIMRMRGYDQDDKNQTIKLVTNKELPINKEELLKNLDKNEKVKKQKVYEAVEQEIQSMYYIELLKHILQKTSLDEETNIIRKAEGLFYKTESIDPATLFLNFTTQSDPEDYFEKRIEHYSTIYQKSTGITDHKLMDEIKKTIMDNILPRYEAFFPEKIETKSSNSTGGHVQVQKLTTVKVQVQVLQEKEEQKERQQEVQDPGIKPNPIYKWRSIQDLLQTVQYIESQDNIEKIDLFEKLKTLNFQDMDIDPKTIYISPNIISNNSGVLFGNRFLRPSYCTLFVKRKKDNSMRCLALSPIEAENILSILDQNTNNKDYEFQLRGMQGALLSEKNAPLSPAQEILQEKIDLFMGHIDSDLLKKGAWFKKTKKPLRDHLYAFYQQYIYPSYPFKSEAFDIFWAEYGYKKVSKKNIPTGQEIDLKLEIKDAEQPKKEQPAPLEDQPAPPPEYDWRKNKDLGENRIEEEIDAAEKAAKEAEEKRRKAEEEARKKAKEEARLKEELRKTEEARLKEEARKAEVIRLKPNLLAALNQYLVDRPKTLWYRFLSFLHLSIRIKIINAVTQYRDLLTKDPSKIFNTSQEIENDIKRMPGKKSLIFGLDKKPNRLEALIDKKCGTNLSPPKAKKKPFK